MKQEAGAFPKYIAYGLSPTSGYNFLDDVITSVINKVAGLFQKNGPASPLGKVVASPLPTA